MNLIILTKVHFDHFDLFSDWEVLLFVWLWFLKFYERFKKVERFIFNMFAIFKGNSSREERTCHDLYLSKGLTGYNCGWCLPWDMRSWGSFVLQGQTIRGSRPTHKNEAYMSPVGHPGYTNVQIGKTLQ